MFFGFASLPASIPPAENPSTGPLRAHLEHMRKALAQVERLLNSVRPYPETGLNADAFILDQFFMEGISEHVAAAEQVLFSMLAEDAAMEEILTALRQDAQAMRELSAEFHQLIIQPEHDMRAIRRKGLQALSQARAYFTKEESVIYPYLDQHFTAEEVIRQLVPALLDHSYDTGPVSGHASSHHMAKHHRPRE